MNPGCIKVAADYSTNVAEMVEYLVNRRIIRHMDDGEEQ
jgi:hypothetical protein